MFYVLVTIVQKIAMESLECVKAVDYQQVITVKLVDMEWISTLDVLNVSPSGGTRTLRTRRNDVEVCLGVYSTYRYKQRCKDIL